MAAPGAPAALHSPPAALRAAGMLFRIVPEAHYRSLLARCAAPKLGAAALRAATTARFGAEPGGASPPSPATISVDHFLRGSGLTPHPPDCFDAYKRPCMSADKCASARGVPCPLPLPPVAGKKEQSIPRRGMGGDNCHDDNCHDNNYDNMVLIRTDPY